MASPADFQQLRQRLRAGLARFIVGNDEIIDGVLTCLFTGGHCLLEGIPGLGKTLLVRALSALIDAPSSRIQFTPDLMPADITGTNILQETPAGKRELIFQPGPLFAPLVLADEINRATPKTQSALLEAMQEKTVTANGKTYPLPAPFIVLATQNPLEMEGTYHLPEAQLDRFMFKLLLTPPDEKTLAQILRVVAAPENPANKLTGATDAGADDLKVCDAATIVEWQTKIRDVLLSETVINLTARIVGATSPDNPRAGALVKKYARYGAGPRGALAIIAAARANALGAGRAHCETSDIIASAAPALRHRIILNFSGEAENVSADALVAEAVANADA